MILFHASPVVVEKPDALHSRREVDFGPGFYLTALKDQAVSWCRRILRHSEQSYISSYELEDKVFDRVKKLIFDSYSEQWLDFVMACRSGLDQTDYDIVQGGIANDRVFNTMELFYAGLIDKTTALGRLRFEKPNNQICIRSQWVIDEYLHYLGSEKQ